MSTFMLMSNSAIQIIIVSVMFIACQGTGKPITASCQKIGQQCRLKAGELGVCSPVNTGEKLACLPQH